MCSAKRILCKLRHYASTSILKNVYFDLIYPYLQYSMMTCRVGSIHFFLIFKFKFIDFEKIKFKFKFIDWEKTKFKFIDFEKSKFKFIDFAKVEFKFINNLWADSNSIQPPFYTKDSKRILLFAPSKSQSRCHRCVLAHRSQGLQEGGSGGTSYPGLGGPGSRGPEEFRFPRIKFWYGTITP